MPILDIIGPPPVPEPSLGLGAERRELKTDPDMIALSLAIRSLYDLIDVQKNFIEKYCLERVPTTTRFVTANNEDVRLVPLEWLTKLVELAHDNPDLMLDSSLRRHIDEIIKMI